MASLGRLLMVPHLSRLPASSTLVTSPRLSPLLQRYGPASYLPITACSVRHQYSLEDARRDILLAGDHTQFIKDAPMPVMVLGGAGLLPFVSVPIMSLSGSFDPAWAFNQLAYGASILAFLGGTRWAAELHLEDYGFGVEPTYRSLFQAVSPALLSWLSLIMFPVWFGLMTVAGGLVWSAYLDIFRSSYPNWYKGMRAGLTAVAVGAIFLTLIFKMILKEKKPYVKVTKREVAVHTDK